MRRPIFVAAGLAALLVPLAFAQDLSVRDRAGAPSPDDLAPALEAPPHPGAVPGMAPFDPLPPRRAKPRADAPHPPRDAFPAIVRFLGLESRTDEVREILARRGAAVRPLLEEIDAREQRLRQLVAEGAPPGVIGLQVLEIHEMRQQVRTINARSVAAFVDLLDPDQVERYHAVVRASRLQPVVRAFGALRLLPPPAPPGQGEE